MCLGLTTPQPHSSIPQASVMLDSNRNKATCKWKGQGWFLLLELHENLETRTQSCPLNARCYESAPAPAQVEAGDERVVWSQPSPLLQQPRTPSSSREGLFIFLKTVPVLLGGKRCTQGRAELQILQQHSQKPAAERMAVLCLGPSQQHPLSSTAPLQGLLQSSE